MILSLLLLALAQAPEVDLLIKGGTVVTIDREMRVLDGASIAIRGNRIDAVIPRGGALPPAKETIDASGQIVLPGLVNTHGHVPMVLLRGIADDMKLMDWLTKVIFPAEAKNVDSEFCYWGTLLGSIEMLRSGTTTFTDMYYFEDDIARAVDEIGMRAVLGQTIIGFPAPDYKTPAESLAATEAFIVKYKSHPRVIPSPAPHAIYTTPIEVVRQARDLAVKYGVPFQIHARESPDEDAQVMAKFGKDTIQVLDEAGILGPGVILHHAVTVTADDIARIAAKGASTSHNPGSNLKVAAGIAPVPELRAAGVAVGLGTDGAASNNSLDLFGEMMTAAKMHKAFRNDTTAMAARDVLAMATIGGARALGLADRIGSIEAGKLADLAIVDPRVPELTPLYDVYSALVYTAKGADVRTVIVDGRVVVRDRKVTTMDADTVMSHARTIQQRILKSLGRDEAR
jgi:5-methylthioadenosine/S-adenosylhomocysteine deaminase